MARSIWDSLRAHFRAHPRLKVVCLSLLLGLPLVLVLAGPWILVETSLRQQLVSWIAPQFQGTCTIGKASLGWFSTVELRDVEVMSREDAPLLSDAEITLDRTLLELLFEGIDGATLTIANPHIDLVADDRSTLPPKTFGLIHDVLQLGKCLIDGSTDVGILNLSEHLQPLQHGFTLSI